MPLSLYQTATASFNHGLLNLSAILAKAKAHAEANGIDPDSYVTARLAADMFALAGQVQSASDAAKFGAARLGKVTPPSFPDTETTFDQLQARVATTLEFIATVSASQIDASEGGTVTMKAGGKERTFASGPYLLHFVLPNFYFHVTTAYDILRAQGVPLVKMDYLGSFEAFEQAA